MDILDQIKPTKEEAEKTLNLAHKIIKRIKIKHAKPILGGSGAKGTWLKGSHDMDIYVKFPLSFEKKDISKILEKELKKKFKLSKIHGSRDYFQIKQKGFTIEIIPILDIKKASQAKNITDVSPLHSKWVKSKTDMELRDQIRLTKAFFKANKLYGAESYIKGFSGYVLEILTIHYGSFEKLMKAVKSWKVPLVIDTEKHNSQKNLNLSKRSPLIIIDPVQEDRNASAALSKEMLEELIKLSNKKLSFVKKEIKKDKYNLIIKIKPVSGKKDIVGARLLKGLTHLIRNIQEFKPTSHTWEWEGDAHYYLKTKITKLPKYKRHYGPKLKDEKNIKKFKLKHKKKRFYKAKGKIYVNLENKNRDIKSYIKKILKQEYYKNKIKKVNFSS